MEALILACARTPVGRFGGVFRDVPASELGAAAISGALERAGADPFRVEEVIMGCVLTAGQGQNVARQAASRAGIGHEVPAFVVNKVCGSGLKSVVLGAQAVLSRAASLVVAGGMESMSRAPYLLDKCRWGLRLGGGEMADALLKDGLSCDFGGGHMGLIAENLADRFSITREEQDHYALMSHRKAHAAQQRGVFSDEIVQVPVKNRVGEKMVADDEHIRANLTLEALAKLPPVFKKEGTVTAGNSSGINDGAAAAVIASPDTADELGAKPLARILGFGSAGVDPDYYGIAPVAASKKALDMAGASPDDLLLIELNEAFAVQSLSVLKETGWDPEKVNVSGGAIALGHPIGASGARVLVTLLSGLRARGGGLGLATLCIGGGQGVALVVEALR